MEEKGLIQIYTGRGKGKTTAAIGQIIRALGHDLKACLIYFHKDPKEWNYGEFDVLKDLGVEVRGFAKEHPHFNKGISEEKIRKDCLEGLEFARKIFEEKSFDLILLDEIIISIRDGFLKEEEVLELLERKPEKTELVLTGRGASEKLIKKADLVSEVEKIKHPYDEGMKSRPGFEF